MHRVVTMARTLDCTQLCVQHTSWQEVCALDRHVYAVLACGAMRMCTPVHMALAKQGLRDNGEMRVAALTRDVR
jgi:hypothetical protein